MACAVDRCIKLLQTYPTMIDLRVVYKMVKAIQVCPSLPSCDRGCKVGQLQEEGIMRHIFSHATERELEDIERYIKVTICEKIYCGFCTSKKEYHKLIVDAFSSNATYSMRELLHDMHGKMEEVDRAFAFLSSKQEEVEKFQMKSDLVTKCETLIQERSGHMGLAVSNLMKRNPAHNFLRDTSLRTMFEAQTLDNLRILIEFMEAYSVEKQAIAEKAYLNSFQALKQDKCAEESAKLAASSLIDKDASEKRQKSDLVTECARMTQNSPGLSLAVRSLMERHPHHTSYSHHVSLYVMFENQTLADLHILLDYLNGVASNDLKKQATAERTYLHVSTQEVMETPPIHPLEALRDKVVRERQEHNLLQLQRVQALIREKLPFEDECDYKCEAHVLAFLSEALKPLFTCRHKNGGIATIEMVDKPLAPNHPMQAFYDEVVKKRGQVNSRILDEIQEKIGATLPIHTDCRITDIKANHTMQYICNELKPWFNVRKMTDHEISIQVRGH